MRTVIYHNPQCSKSRRALELLREHGINPEIVHYLQTPPDAAELRKILQQLGITARDLMRKGEEDYKAAHTELDRMNEPSRIDWLAQHPRVIERPIVVTANGARIGRPPENILEILD